MAIRLRLEIGGAVVGEEVKILLDIEIVNK
jgi:hypothetical protein